MSAYVLRTLRTLVVLAPLLAAGFATSGYAQQFQKGEHAWPDTIQTITVSGVVIVNLDAMHPLYFIDVKEDGKIDYHLSFGPWWYEPTSGVQRPQAGEVVEIYGALMAGEDDDVYQTVLVFEIDGLVWRTPVEIGTTGMNSEPVWDATGGGSSAIVTVLGVVFVDTTYYYDHYYLDTTGDTIPEYKLGFGPYWYEPESGAVRPSDGAEVTVEGRLHEFEGIDLITVFYLDGLLWREANKPAPWAGEWIPSESGGVVRVRARNNFGSWIDFPPHFMGDMGGGGNGTGGNGHGGNMPWPDSVFAQFWEIHPDSMPGPQRERRFIGFFVGLEDSAGRGLMIRDRDRIRLHTQERLHLCFEYHDRDLTSRGLDENGMVLQYWDETLDIWRDVPDTQIDVAANTITVGSFELASFYSVVAPATTTAIATPLADLPLAFVLKQNYPNPFNPTTIIPYALTAPQHVTLTLYDVLGRRVTVLVDAAHGAGEFEFAFDASGLPAGTYFYEMRGDDGRQLRYLVLNK